MFMFKIWLKHGSNNLLKTPENRRKSRNSRTQKKKSDVNLTSSFSEYPGRESNPHDIATTGF